MADTKKVAKGATKKAAGAAADAISLAELFNQGKSWIKANPRAALGTGALGAANVAGLLDNDKVLGQGVGAVAGYALPAIASLIAKRPVTVSPLMRANLAMGGGTLGALFDNLRAKKEQEQAMAQQQYYGG